MEVAVLGVEHLAPAPGGGPSGLVRVGATEGFGTKKLQFLDVLHQPERFAFRSTSITAQYEAVCASAGLAVLPAFMADRDPILARVLPQEARFTRTFWMSRPIEGKHLARMQALWEG